MSDQNLFGETIEAKRDAARARVRAIKLSEPLPNPRYRILSLGGGVQSCALALMSARGELDKLDYAIFADTGWEKARTYRYLDWLETQLPFPLIRLKRPGLDLGTYQIENTRHPQAKRPMAPFYVDDPFGMLSKQCSKEWKTRVVQRELRRLLGMQPGERGGAEPLIELWLGMTTDELQRMSVNERKWIHNRYPLLERRMAKMDLYPWYEQRQYRIPPKSSCIFCPLQRPDQFREIREDGEDWPRLVEFDRAIRPGYLGMQGSAYLVRQCKPIELADLSSPADLGQDEFEYHCGDTSCGL